MINYLTSGLDWSRWVYGLLSGIISGGAGAASAGIAVIVVDPKDFNLGAGKFWAVVSITFMIGAATNFFNYLKSNPLPSFKTETLTQRVEASGTTTTTAQKTELTMSNKGQD